MRAEHDSLPEIALRWHTEGRGAALATVVETWGSAPRQAGSQLAISGQGEIMGSVSGGCVEGAVITEALDALADGNPRLLTFGVSDETAFNVGLACGGTIKILVEPVGDGVQAQSAALSAAQSAALSSALSAALLADLVAARAERRAVAMVTDLVTWARTMHRPGDDAAIDARFRSDRSGMGGEAFVAIHNPPLRMIVVGAVHIAQPLLTIARTCGYDCTLIDPRAAFGSAARFPGEVIVEDWPDEALEALAPDARTAIVTLTHDPKLDDPAIRAALASPVFYLGCLGSPKTHAKRVERLVAAGFSPDQIARINAPVGLDIGAKTPAEIAVSVMGQITHALRKG
jgi:xanthine dehydrogenase accessory factor